MTAMFDFGGYFGSEQDAVRWAHANGLSAMDYQIRQEGDRVRLDVRRSAQDKGSDGYADRHHGRREGYW